MLPEADGSCWGALKVDGKVEALQVLCIVFDVDSLPRFGYLVKHGWGCAIKRSANHDAPSQPDLA